MKSTAVVLTPHSARYMGQLVKHFAHKLPTALEGDSGRIDFPIGTCTVTAGPALILTCEAQPQDMAQLQDVVARHLVRFAFRENELAVSWTEAGA
jgi:hypothetical protein